ncbi:ornithine carbamoyltransferase [Methanopyrus kandleri]|uniref:Ornithine carbamoyltransferase n=1 Tax=Methanopyrus kandleri (strain AV19 / DSM 6324 / JCM 9639 / NBRC 100938) TaxID=190192 RepID=OTC_METKA|nr:ornithine carbamoyltransferase [Methanopyrus kandleri]Q8TWG4.1 RecName: Full=Ornithine carbamoyltransferase; Short=OTCase [Methanopyrus kandleri AV19]AAM02283.1 Ornithine carbamoyltransferase [Methanopyrus kandleri AV19]
MRLKRLSTNHLLSIADLDREDVETVLRVAERFKERYLAGERVIPILEGKTLGLIFEKPSTRTRVSFEVAMHQLGGQAFTYTKQELQLGRGEAIKDTAAVLSRYLDGVMIRARRHEDIEEFARYSEVPVINGLSDLEHPCQALTDAFTIREKLGRGPHTVAFVGDGNNVCSSLALVCATLGWDFVHAVPEGYECPDRVWREVERRAEESGSETRVVRDPKEAVREADVVYTDVWVSMGDEAEREERLRVFRPYQVNEELMSHAPEHAIVMHCMPIQRGYELTDDVADSERSVIYDQAENRLHVQKAILALLMG